MLAVNSDAHDRARRAETLLREMGLEHRMAQYPNQLSAGERQRVAIARALANHPSILLADEPTGNLDSKNSARIMEMLIQIQKEHGMTLIAVRMIERCRRETRKQSCRSRPSTTNRRSADDLFLLGF
jgi:putative ABC transport system ATP-binding protein